MNAFGFKDFFQKKFFDSIPVSDGYEGVYVHRLSFIQMVQGFERVSSLFDKLKALLYNQEPPYRTIQYPLRVNLLRFV